MSTGAWLSFACWAGAEAGWIAGRPGGGRIAWPAGAAALAAHAAAAFQWRHHWSHAEAVADTARQTSAAVGLHWGGGVWFNYAMAAAWTADAVVAWRRTGPPARGVRLFFAFMWWNGAVIFARSWLRWPACAIFVALGWRLWRLRRKRIRGAPGAAAGV